MNWDIGSDECKFIFEGFSKTFILLCENSFNRPGSPSTSRILYTTWSGVWVAWRLRERDAEEESLDMRSKKYLVMFSPYHASTNLSVNSQIKYNESREWYQVHDYQVRPVNVYRHVGRIIPH